MTRDAEEETKKLCPNDGSPNLLLDCPRATLYLRFAHERELKVLHSLSNTVKIPIDIHYQPFVCPYLEAWVSFRIAPPPGPSPD